MSFEIKDLAGLGEPIKKLIEVISQGIGGIYEKHLIKRNADAKAYEIQKLTEAMYETQKLLPSAEYEGGILKFPAKSTSEIDIFQRMEQRVKYQQAVKQLNIESVTANAVSELLNDPDVEETKREEPVDSDWIIRFFETVENVNDEQMQRLWGKILAGEVKRPNSYSIRTIDTLRNMSYQEAKLFSKIGRLAIFYENDFLFYLPKFEYSFFTNFLKITTFEILSLRDIGLLSAGKSQIKFKDKTIGNEDKFYYSNHEIIVSYNNKFKVFNYPAQFFSKTGSELIKLLQPEFNKEYAQFAFNQFWKNKHTVSFRETIRKSDKNLSVKQFENLY